MKSFAVAFALITGSAAAQPVATRAQALAEDAAQYAARFAVSPDEAARRLKAQQASVAATDAIAAEFADRLAGIAVDNEPDYRIVVLLTGDAPVAERDADGARITFQTGARATHAQAVAALRKHLIDARTELPGMRGAGYDQRTGEIVLLVTSADAARFGTEAIRKRAEQVGGVPVRVLVNDLIESNMSVAGGGLVRGSVDGARYRCTSGFVVTDGSRTGLATAAHCPDELAYEDLDGVETPLPFVGQWGLGYHDVQVNLAPDGTEPLFFANRAAAALRRLDTWRNVASTRAGDFVCHYGVSSGYSCATVELTDYAPPGALCGGPCSPTWVTVGGPNCMTGDSGGPVFSGTVAFGIAKGVNRNAAGRCNFYYYMSTDYLPPPWRLMTASGAISRSSDRRAPGR